MFLPEAPQRPSESPFAIPANLNLSSLPGTHVQSLRPRTLRSHHMLHLYCPLVHLSSSRGPPSTLTFAQKTLPTLPSRHQGMPSGGVGCEESDNGTCEERITFWCEYDSRARPLHRKNYRHRR